MLLGDGPSGEVELLASGAGYCGCGAYAGRYDIVVTDFGAVFLSSATIDGLHSDAVESFLEDVDGIAALIDIGTRVGFHLVFREEVGHFLHGLGESFVLVGIENVGFVVVDVEAIGELGGVDEVAVGVLEREVQHDDGEGIHVLVVSDAGLGGGGSFLCEWTEYGLEVCLDAVDVVVGAVGGQHAVCAETHVALVEGKGGAAVAEDVFPCIGLAVVVGFAAAEVEHEAGHVAGILHGEDDLVALDVALHPRIGQVVVADAADVDILVVETYIDEVARLEAVGALVFHGIRLGGEVCGRRDGGDILEVVDGVVVEVVCPLACGLHVPVLILIFGIDEADAVVGGSLRVAAGVLQVEVVALDEEGDFSLDGHGRCAYVAVHLDASQLHAVVVVFKPIDRLAEGDCDLVAFDGSLDPGAGGGVGEDVLEPGGGAVLGEDDFAKDAVLRVVLEIEVHIGGLALADV